MIVIPGSESELPCEIEYDVSLNATIQWVFRRFDKKSLPMLGNGEEVEKYLEAKTWSPRSSHGTFSRPFYPLKNSSGKYECIARTYDHKGVVQTKAASAYVTAAVNPCDVNPCVNGGSCLSATGTNEYECVCLNVFYGTQCQYFDSLNYGLKGASTFDNSFKKNHILELDCDFGPEAKDYTITQWFPNRAPKLIKNSTQNKIQIKLKLISPKRASLNYETDHKSVINCSASIGDTRVADGRRIEFYEFMRHGESHLYFDNAHRNLTWSINGGPENTSKEFNKVWQEVPGRIYKLLGKSPDYEEEWDVMVCGFVQRQIDYMSLTVVTLFAIAIIVPLLLLIYTAISCHQPGGNLPSTIPVRISVSTKFERLIAALVGSLNGNLLKSIIRPVKFILNTKIGEIFVAVALIYRKDVNWGYSLLVIILIFWLLNLASFAYLLRSHTHAALYTELRAKGWLKLTALALFNQSHATIENDLDDDIIATTEDPRRKEKKMKNRNIFSFYSVCESFLLLSLISFILSEMMGSEHICLPPPRIFDFSETPVPDLDFKKYSLRSIIPEKHHTLTGFIKMAEQKDAMIFDKLIGCQDPSTCACNTWKVEIDHCLLPRQYPSHWFNENIRCHVYDCFQAPCILQLVLPLLLLLKTSMEISAVIVAKIDCQSSGLLVKALRFVFVEWTIIISLYFCFYFSDLLQGITLSPSYKLLLFTVPFIILKLVSPFHCARYFASRARRRAAFCLWFILGYIYMGFIQVGILALLLSYRGCDRNPRNRLTFARGYGEEDYLYVLSTRGYWNQIVTDRYSKDFNVR